MADQSQSTLKDSTVVDGSPSKIGNDKRKKKKTEILEPADNWPGYIDGEFYPYRGRNMDSFCRKHKDKIYTPE